MYINLALKLVWGQATVHYNLLSLVLGLSSLFSHFFLYFQEEDDITVTNVRVEELMSAGSVEVVHYEQLTIVVGKFCDFEGQCLCYA